MTFKNYSELYQQIILSHNKAPKNFRKMTDPCYSTYGQNQMCGDHISLHLAFNKKEFPYETLLDVSFEGEGCAILIASASMMTELLKGKSLLEIDELMIEFRKILSGEIEYSQKLGEINVFVGLTKFQSRIQCAMLAWDTLMKGINKQC